MPNPRPHRRFTAICLTALTISLTVAASGCQEDSRASHSTIARSAELTDNRLKQATGNLLQTLGQVGPADKPEPEQLHRPALNWSLPLTREDGSALPAEQIAGFQIYYRLRHQSTDQVIAVNDPTATRYPLDDLPTGAYQFAITVLDANGQESRRSAPVTADIL